MEQTALQTANPAYGNKSLTNEEYLTDLKNFADTSPLALYWINDKGIINHANDAVFYLLGFSGEELMNKHISLIYTNEYETEDILKRIAKGESLYNYPARLRCKNGAIKNVLINSKAIIMNGVHTLTQCYITDITELKKEETKTKSELARLQDINTRLLWKTGGYKPSAQFSRIFNKSLR